MQDMKCHCGHEIVLEEGWKCTGCGKEYTVCSRCDGEGDDPEISDCTCDCCGGSGFE